jgi:hypothetical protein
MTAMIVACATRKGKHKVEAKKMEQITKGMLIAALIRYRESSIAADRPAMAGFAGNALRELVDTSHVGEDILIQNAIAIYHNNTTGDEQIRAVELLRDFRSSLTDAELEALLDATK